MIDDDPGFVHRIHHKYWSETKMRKLITEPDAASALLASLSVGEWTCSTDDCYQMTRRLLKGGADINILDDYLGRSVLFNPLMTPSLFDLLIEHGAYPLINKRDSSGTTPLMEVQSVEVARKFVENGANVNFVNWRNKTVLSHFAEVFDDDDHFVAFNKRQIYDFLVSVGAK